jgi:hypothetical protein
VPFCAGAVDQLTKAALHFGWEKIRGQAALLVKRFAKFEKALPAAESKLASQLDLLTDTPAAARPALVAEMRRELQSLAAGERPTRDPGGGAVYFFETLTFYTAAPHCNRPSLGGLQDADRPLEVHPMLAQPCRCCWTAASQHVYTHTGTCMNITLLLCNFRRGSWAPFFPGCWQ